MTTATQKFDAAGRPLPRLRMQTPDRPLFLIPWAADGTPVHFAPDAISGELGGLGALRELLDGIIRRQRDYPADTVAAAAKARALIRAADWGGLRGLCFDWNRAPE
jgi:hypothetical protein